MRRNQLKLVLAALILLVAAVSLWPKGVAGQPFASPHQVSIDSQCTSPNGVSIAIDFGKAAPNRAPIQRCVTATADLTGWAALQAASVQVEGTAQYPTGFVCRILGVPGKSQQPCIDTPSVSDGHWAYFYASPKTNGHWLYSGAGAAAREPKCGEAEGWRFEGPDDSAMTPPSVHAWVHKCGAE